MSAETYSPAPLPDDESLKNLFDAPSISDDERWNPKINGNAGLEGNTDSGTAEAVDTDPDSLIVTPEADVESGAEAQPETRDAYTITADAAERLVIWLRNRSETKGDRKEARQQTAEQAKEVVIRIGSRALDSLKTVDVVTVGLGILAYEAGSAKVSETRDKVVDAADAAKARLAERVARYKQNRADKAYDRMRDEANAEDDAFEENKRLEEIEAARLEAEELAMLNEAHADDDAFDENRRLEAAAAAEAERAEEERQLELQERRQAALLRKQERKAKREAFYGKARDKGSELWTKAKGFGKRIGLAALGTYHRTRAAASAAASAGRETWNQLG